MSLQDSILGALNAKALTRRALIEALQADGADIDGFDFAIGSLVKDARVALRCGHYERTAAPVEPSPKKTPRPRRGLPVPGGTLTHREEQIAELTAAGETAQQLAERLGLSRKTVDGHLSHIYLKLQIRGKAELAHRMRLRAAASLSVAERMALVEEQRRTAEELQALLNQVAAKRQELQEVEERVRAATGRAT